MPQVLLTFTLFNRQHRAVLCDSEAVAIEIESFDSMRNPRWDYVETVSESAKIVITSLAAQLHAAKCQLNTAAAAIDQLKAQTPEPSDARPQRDHGPRFA